MPRYIRIMIIIIFIELLMLIALMIFNNLSHVYIIAKQLEVEDYQVSQIMSELPIVVKEELEVCSSSPAKSYMFGQSITSKTSNQYKLLQTMKRIDGFYYTYDDYMGVALGSYFGNVGDKFTITLDTGIVLKVVKLDRKDDSHTGSLNCQHRIDGSVIEMIVDRDNHTFPIYSNGYIFGGNFNNSKEFNGSIIKIEKEK